jgi:hypothetical protein
MTNKIVVDLNYSPTIIGFNEANKYLKENLKTISDIPKIIGANTSELRTSIENIKRLYDFPNIPQIDMSEILKSTKMATIGAPKDYIKNTKLISASIKEISASLKTQGANIDVIKASYSSLSNMQSIEKLNFRALFSELTIPLEANKVDESTIQAAEEALQEISAKESLQPIFKQSGITEENQLLIFDELNQIKNSLNALNENSSQPSTENVNDEINNDIVPTNQISTPFYKDSMWHLEQVVSVTFQSIVVVSANLENPIFLLIFTTFVIGVLKKHSENR